MLYWAFVFLIVAVVGAVLGLGGIAQISAGIAQVLIFIFIVLFVIALVAGLVGRARRGGLPR